MALVMKWEIQHHVNIENTLSHFCMVVSRNGQEAFMRGVVYESKIVKWNNGVNCSVYVAMKAKGLEKASIHEMRNFEIMRKIVASVR